MTTPATPGLLERARELEFRAIPEFPDYGVTRCGQVKRITPRDKRAAARPAAITPFRDAKGYKLVRLYRNGHSQNVGVHRCIALAWIPNPEKKPLVAHLDGTKDNNSIENLMWANEAENAFHMIAHGTHKTGSQTSSAKLNDESVLEIRNKYRPREYTTMQLAQEYGVSNATISAVIRGQTWRHVGGPTYDRLDVLASPNLGKNQDPRTIPSSVAEARFGGRLDRRHTYGLIGGEVCISMSYTGTCSGCFETGDYGSGSENYSWDGKAHCYVGAGCHECGYTGKIRHSMWIPVTSADLIKRPQSEARAFLSKIESEKP